MVGQNRPALYLDQKKFVRIRGKIRKMFEGQYIWFVCALLMTRLWRYFIYKITNSYACFIPDGMVRQNRPTLCLDQEKLARIRGEIRKNVPTILGRERADLRRVLWRHEVSNVVFFSVEDLWKKKAFKGLSINDQARIYHINHPAHAPLFALICKTKK